MQASKPGFGGGEYNITQRRYNRGGWCCFSFWVLLAFFDLGVVVNGKSVNNYIIIIYSTSADRRSIDRSAFRPFDLSAFYRFFYLHVLAPRASLPFDKRRPTGFESISIWKVVSIGGSPKSSPKGFNAKRTSLKLLSTSQAEALRDFMIVMVSLDELGD